LQLFFDEFWKPKSDIVSFGHDIEASWLLCETADVLDDEKLGVTIKNAALKLVNAALRDGFSEKNAIYTEMNGKGEIFKNIQWWQQAESVVGLLNAFKISQSEKYYMLALNAWKFVENYFIDKIDNT
jgi:mannobiose 2-epimerase